MNGKASEAKAQIKATVRTLFRTMPSSRSEKARYLQRLRSCTAGGAARNGHERRRWEELGVPKAVSVVPFGLRSHLLFLAGKPHSAQLRLGRAVAWAKRHQSAQIALVSSCSFPIAPHCILREFRFQSGPVSSFRYSEPYLALNTPASDQRSNAEQDYLYVPNGKMAVCMLQSSVICPMKAIRFK